jgi:hypothetical protein
MPLTVLAPWFAIAGLLAAAAIVAAHFIGARTRAPLPLPTARFVPRLQERSSALERRPRDLLLMLLRATILALTGFALAGPVSAARERSTVKIVVADVAGSAHATEVLERAVAAAGEDGLVVISDTGIRVSNARDVTGSPAVTGGTVSLTAALVQAIREAAALGARGHPVELAIVSGFAGQAVDSATAAVRALWPGSAALVEVTGRTAPPPRGDVTFSAEDGDPLRATAALLPSGSGAPVVIRRGPLTATDSARAAGGAVVVHWPRAGLPDSFAAAAPDTIGGVWISDYAFVTPLPRAAVFSGSDNARVVARWIDGPPAAVERPHGAGCLRSVAIEVPDAGDLSISPGWRRVAAALTGPCGGGEAPASPAAVDRAVLAGNGPRQAMLHPATGQLRGTRLTTFLLLAALLVLLLELGVRRWRP